MRHSDVNGGNTFCSPNLNENCSHSTKHFWPGNLFMRTMLQFGDVLLVISICLGRAPSLSTIKHQLMPFPQQIASTIIRPCLRQFSFKFCDHRSPPPPPYFSHATALRWLSLLHGYSERYCNCTSTYCIQAKPCTSTRTQPRYCDKHKQKSKILQQAQHVC